MDFYDEWLRNELWTFEEAAMLFNGWDPVHAKDVGFKFYDSDNMDDWKKPILKTYKQFLRTNWSKWDPNALNNKATHRDIFLQNALDKAIPFSDTLKLRYVLYIKQIKQNKAGISADEKSLGDRLGGHTTRKLEILCEAKEKFWDLYDKDDPSTAPTNKQVEDWLVEQVDANHKKISKKMAASMATILRDESLPSGPRK